MEKEFVNGLRNKEIYYHRMGFEEGRIKNFGRDGFRGDEVR